MTLNNATLPPGRLALECAFAFVLGFFAAFTVMDVSWWGPDDGAYAYVAERLLAGDVLHKDIQDIHAGYVNFANAAALSIFGNNILSLRWPLVIFAGFETALVYWLARRHAGLLPAVFAGLCIALLAFPLHPNISANWYAFGLSIILAVTLAKAWRSRPLQWVFVGLLIMAVFLFRQTTGLFVGIGAFTVLVLRESAPVHASVSRAWAGAGALAIASVLLLTYLVKLAQPAGFLAFGLPPLLVLGAAVLRSNLAPLRLGGMAGFLALGGLIAIAPLAAYHVAHGSAMGWFNDAVLAPLHMSSFEFFEKRSYFHILILSFGKIGEVGATALANSLFWCLLLAAPAMIAWSLWRVRAEWVSNPFAPFAIIALFYGLVSLHYEIFIYLFYSTGFLLSAFILIARRPWRRVAYLAVGAAMVIGLNYHVGQPAIRPLPAGSVGAPVVLARLAEKKAPVRAGTEDIAVYDRLLQLIDQCSLPNQPIFAMPSNAELYYLSGRRNPFSFYSTAFGLNDAGAVENARKVLFSSDGPELVIMDPDDKYHTPQSRALVAAFKGKMNLLAVIGRHHVYKRSQAGMTCNAYARQITEELNA